MQHRVVNRAGKPLTCLERTSDTDSLMLAKELYLGILSELNQLLAERSGWILETKRLPPSGWWVSCLEAQQECVAQLAAERGARVVAEFVELELPMEEELNS